MPVEGGKAEGSAQQQIEGGRGREVGSSVPDILLLIPSQYFSLVVNEIRYVMQLLLPAFFMLICLHDCAWYDTYCQLLGQLFIPVQIVLPSRADLSELRVFGSPICEVVFWKDGEMGALLFSSRYVVGGFVVVELRFKGLLTEWRSGRMPLVEGSG